jgi:hypothetical protein
MTAASTAASPHHNRSTTNQHPTSLSLYLLSLSLLFSSLASLFLLFSCLSPTDSFCLFSDTMCVFSHLSLSPFFVSLLFSFSLCTFRPLQIKVNSPQVEHFRCVSCVLLSLWLLFLLTQPSLLLIYSRLQQQCPSWPLMMFVHQQS